MNSNNFNQVDSSGFLTNVHKTIDLIKQKHITTKNDIKSVESKMYYIIGLDEKPDEIKASLFFFFILNMKIY